MIKKYCMLAALCYSMILNAMQEPMHTAPTQKNWLFCLPSEIHDLIAHYLTFDDFETEEEFIERSKIPQTMPPNLHDIIDHTLQLQRSCKHAGLVAPSPNNTAFIYLALTYNTVPLLPLVVIDMPESKALIQNEIMPRNYKKIALSRNVQLYATIHTHLVMPLLLNHRFNAIEETKLIIRKINSSHEKKEQTIQIKQSFRLLDYHHTIAFNKQGTHLIAHGIDSEKDSYRQKNDILHHIIVPIILAQEDKPLDKKTLKHYFFQNGIYIENWNCKRTA